MTYPKKFFWIYLTTISLFLIGLQHLQRLNTPRTYSCKTVKKSCKKSYAYSYEFHEFSNQIKIIKPLPISSNLIKHSDTHYSVFNDNKGFSSQREVLRTKIRVGKDGSVRAIDIIGQRKRHCRKKKRTKRYHEISNLQFIPGTIDGKPSEFWVNVDFRY